MLWLYFDDYKHLIYLFYIFECFSLGVLLNNWKIARKTQACVKLSTKPSSPFYIVKRALCQT